MSLMEVPQWSPAQTATLRQLASFVMLARPPLAVSRGLDKAPCGFAKGSRDPSCWGAGCRVSLARQVWRWPSKRGLDNVGCGNGARQSPTAPRPWHHRASWGDGVPSPSAERRRAAATTQRYRRPFLQLSLFCRSFLSSSSRRSAASTSASAAEPEDPPPPALARSLRASEGHSLTQARQ